jgi:hypothetical protein
MHVRPQGNNTVRVWGASTSTTEPGQTDTITIPYTAGPGHDGHDGRDGHDGHDGHDRNWGGSGRTWKQGQWERDGAAAKTFASSYDAGANHSYSFAPQPPTWHGTGITKANIGGVHMTISPDMPGGAGSRPDSVHMTGQQVSLAEATALATISKSSDHDKLSHAAITGHLDTIFKARASMDTKSPPPPPTHPPQYCCKCRGQLHRQMG